MIVREEHSKKVEMITKEYDMQKSTLVKSHMEKVTSMEYSMQEVKTYHERRVAESVSAHDDTKRRLEAQVAAKDKELTILKNKADSAEASYKDRIEDLQHSLES